MKRILARAKAGLKQAGRWIARVCTPSDRAWAAATWALVAFWVFVLGSFLLTFVAPHPGLGNFTGVVATFGLFALIGLGVVLLARLIALLKLRYRLALALALPPSVLFLMSVWDKKGMAIAVALIMVGLSLTAGAAAELARRGRTRRPYSSMAFLVVGLVALGVLAVGVLRTPKDPNPTLAHYQLAGMTLDMPDPGQPGPYKVRYLTYGSGTDRYRPEFAKKASWRSHAVDGSKLDADWKGAGGWMRSFYWGFDPKRFPVQGRVWAPQGQGPFPLVLLVHGNHEMQDFSDPGYAYLGELLASQGFILVSVDENFLNSALDDMVNPLKRRGGAENDARGWLLLEHLAQWRGWNADPKNPLYGKVDMERVGIVGHSRGGEAVAVAAAFNNLAHYPDDATLPFNYRFKLRAVAAIAPVDSQYKVREQPTPLKDVNYFVLHGSLDGDASSFMGTSQYSRDQLTGAVPGAFKAQLYVKDADHNQFNTSWGRNDLGLPWEFLLDERSLLKPADQRQIAKAYLSAFLQTALMSKEGYRPLFQDPRRGAAWLPKGYLAANYADGRTTWAATFDEDLDPGTATTPGAGIVGRNLSVWRETDVKLKWNPLDTNVALVGWDERVGKGASYAIGLGAAAAAAGPSADLVFSAADAGIGSLPEGFKPPKTKAKTKDDKAPLDWSVVLVDDKGVEARLPLSRDQVLYPQIKGQTRKFPEIDGSKTTEVVMRRYRLPLADFAAANPVLDLTHLKTMRFDFDRSKRGVIALDDVGVAPAIVAP